MTSVKILIKKSSNNKKISIVYDFETIKISLNNKKNEIIIKINKQKKQLNNQQLIYEFNKKQQEKLNKEKLKEEKLNKEKLKEEKLKEEKLKEEKLNEEKLNEEKLKEEILKEITKEEILKEKPCTDEPVSDNKPVKQLNNQSKKKQKCKFNIKTVKQETKIDYPITSILNLKLGYHSINTGKAIMRYFHKQEFDYEQIIHSSRCTYRGMNLALSYMKKSIYEKGLKISDYCVLCPHYSYDENEPNKYWAGGDTQACGGGKLTSHIDEKTGILKCESFEDGVLEELKEELRIIGKNPKLMTKMSNTSNIKNKLITFNTHIYSFNISNCKIIENFDVKLYDKQNRRGQNIANYYVGYIVWGTLTECMEFVSKIKVNPLNFIDGKPIYAERIDAVSIISLTNAIEMSDFAESHYKNESLNVDYVNESFLS